MSRLRFFIVMLTLSLAWPAASAQEPGASGDEAGKISSDTPVPEIKTFRVNPVDRPAAILAPNARVPTPPEPIAPSMMQDLLAGIAREGEGAPAPAATDAEPGPALDHIVLNSRRPYHDGKGYLTLTRPQTFHPESAIIFDKSSPGAVGVKLNVNKDRLYLVDFTVSAVDAGAYKVETESGGQAFEDSNGKLEHVLIALSAGASGWTTVRMNRTGASFNLYSVEVTRVN
jgi:hypothetical protein